MCGFVEGVGQANYPCRQCYVHKSEILNVFKHGDSLLRQSEDSYALVNQTDKKGLVKIPNFWRFNFFDAVIQTPQDIMHILLEGICRRQVMCIFEE